VGANAVVGGTPASARLASFGGGGGHWIAPARLDPNAYGVLNYTMFAFTKQDLLHRPQRVGTTIQAAFVPASPETNSSHTIGLSHNFNAALQRSARKSATIATGRECFDNGTRKGRVDSMV